MKIIFDTDHYVLESVEKHKIITILDALNDIIKIYEFASVVDLYDLCGAHPKYVDNKRGWRTRIPKNAIKGFIHHVDSDVVTWRLSLPVALYNIPGLTVEKKEDSIFAFKPALPRAAKDAKIQKAYNVLTKTLLDKDADTCDLENAMHDAIGYLGEVLE